jgi:CO/xanthine dehydrogenase Mo-binding subunit
MTRRGPHVGRALPTVDGPAKAQGLLGFLQDIHLPGMLHASMVLSGRAHANIRKTSFDQALSIPGVDAVATCDDVAGQNRIGVVVDDQPLFAGRRVRFEGDCIAIVGAADPVCAIRGAELVEVAFEDLPSAVTIKHSRSPDAPRIHEGGNVAVERIIRRGDIARGEAHSESVIEAIFQSPAQEHAYLEPLGALAVPAGGGSMEILVPGQCPFYVRDAVARCLGIALSKVHVVQLPMGGGFGGKEDVPSEICARLAVLAAKTGRPVRMILSREEDLIYTSKRHPMELRYRMGCDGEGKLTFADIEIDADCGAYATLSPIVLFRSTVHAAGPYEIPNVRVCTKGFYTNTVPKGAMRGFGTPQVVFACESVIDDLAKDLNMDPLEFRLKNALRQGSHTATGQLLEESVGLPETLKVAGRIVGSTEDTFKPRKIGEHRVRAKGMSAMFYGVSLGAAGRTLDRGGARVEVLKDGSVGVSIGCTDMGQGAVTVLSQIAADCFGIGIDRVSLYRVDTNIVPDSGPTVASRTTVISGNAIIDACDKVIGRMVDVASYRLGSRAVYDRSKGAVVSAEAGRSLGFDQVVEACLAERVDLSATGWYVVPECVLDDTSGQGKAYYVYSYATDVAEVEVDSATGEIAVRSVVAVHDSGSIINPLTARAQVEGGVAQGIGLAICERYAQEGGHLCSRDLSTYLVPTAVDVCDDIRVEFVECASADGPFGAKGLGEPAIIPVASAIANAVSNAVGARVRKLPVDRQWVIDVTGRSKTGNPLDAA